MLAFWFKNKIGSLGCFIFHDLIGGVYQADRSAFSFRIAQGSTAKLDCHSKLHTHKPDPDLQPSWDNVRASTKSVAVPVAYAVVLDLLPLYFYDLHVCMMNFVKALFELGQTVPVWKNIALTVYFPC